MTMDHRTTEELTDDKERTELFGPLTLGSGNALCFCPLKREVVHGAEIYQAWSPIPKTVKHTAHLITSILPRPGATLCACHVQGLNTEVRSCVLDAAGNIITVHRVMSVGTVCPKMNVNNSSTEKNIAHVSRIRSIVSDIAHITQRK